VIPVAGELPGYRFPGARRDLVAGVTVAALAVPAAMPYAELAGLSPVNGLYALLLPSVAYLLLGSSRQLIIGPEGSVSTLIAAAILPLAAPASSDAAELAALLALLVAICFAAAWVLRLGWIADYLSRPVLIGYIHGVAVVLVIGQLGKLLGLPVSVGDPLPRLWEVIRELGNISGTTVAVGAAALTVLLLLRLALPKLPAALLVVAAAIAISWALDLRAQWRRCRRPDSLGAAGFHRADGQLGRYRAPGPGGAGHLLRLVRGRDLDRTLLRGQAQPERASPARAAGDGGRERRRRVHARFLGRSQRLAHGGERRHGRSQPDRGPRRGRHRRGDRPVPHRAGPVPAQGRSRRGDRHRRDRADRPRRPGASWPPSTRSRSRSRP
jgi:sulfate permease family protein